MNGLIIVDLTAAPEKNLFLLDTGGGAHFLDPSYIEGNKSLVRAEEQDQFIALATRRERSEAYLWDFSIGPFQMGQSLAFKSDTRRFKKDLDGLTCCSGILGIELFKKWPIEIQRDQKRVFINAKTPSAQDLNWEAWPIQLVEDRTIVLKCRTSKGAAMDLRLDTGSEVPLILQPRFVSNYKISEKLKDQGVFVEKNKPYFVDLGGISCGMSRKASLIDGLVYMTDTGALTHEFIDGNLGNALLGRRYIIDVPHRKIWVHTASLPTTLKLGGITSYEVF